MLARKLLYVGLVLLALALVSLALSWPARRPMQVLVTRLGAEALASETPAPSSPPSGETPAPSGPPNSGGAPAPPPEEPSMTPSGGSATATAVEAATPTEAPSAGAPPPASRPASIVETEWPQRVEFGRSESIRVSLVCSESGDVVPTAEGKGHSVRSATTVPVGTPEALLERAFGAGYESCAVANLVGAAFDIRAVSVECQSLDMSSVTWEWNLVPKMAGPQVVNVNIEVTWKPVGQGGQPIRRQIWRSQLAIRVTKPLIATDQLHLFSSLDALVGSAFSVPWLYERWKEYRGRRKKDEAISPPSQGNSG